MSSKRTEYIHLGKNQRPGSARMASNRIENTHLGISQRPGSARRAGENDPLTRSPPIATDQTYEQFEIANDKDEDMNKLFKALAVIKRTKIEDLEQLLLKHATAKARNELNGQESEDKWAERRDWQTKYEELEIMHKDLKRKFDKIDSEMKGMKDDYQMVYEESESFKAQLRDKERQLQKLEQGRNWQVEYEKLEMMHIELQRKFDEYQKMVMDKTKIEDESDKLKSLFKNTEQELLKQKSEVTRLLKLVEKMDKESKSSKAQLEEKERQLEEQRAARKKAEKEKDDALTRLSRHMGHQMSEGNPNITDLSDQNRPSKLGERYSELYDNEWTNAFEVLTDKIDQSIVDKDESAIKVLRKILLESYKCAFDISRNQMEDAEYKLSGSSKGVGPECKRLLKEARKHIDIKQADDLLKNVLERTLTKVIERTYLTETQVQVFAKECFQLCWLMSIQDPPVVLAEDPIKGDRFDTSMYKHYTNSGDTVDYVVWPALLLHKSGPLLTKGVAQPVPKLRPKSAPALGENKMINSGTFDKKSQTLYGDKVLEKTSVAERRNPSLHGYATQSDAPSWRKVDDGTRSTRTYSSYGSTPPTQRLTANEIQFQTKQALVNDQDKANFTSFCEWYEKYDEPTVREYFSSDFNRYYELYLAKKYGYQSYA